MTTQPGEKTLRDRAAELTARLASACKAAGRATDSVRLIAVSKLHPAELIHEAYDTIGLRDFGENYAQELRDKARALAACTELRWHAIGPVQKKNAKYIAAAAYAFHALDDLAVAEELSRRRTGAPLRCYLEVNVASEASKAGVSPDAVARLAEQVRALPGLALVGLTAMPPLTNTPEESRPHFRQLAELAKGLGLSELSMGTSADFEVAIEEGATSVRVGTALFGERPPARDKPRVTYARMLLSFAIAVTLTQTPDCRPLPAPVSPLPFAQGEVLEFSFDALGVPAGSMTLRLLPQRSDGSWVVESRSQAKSVAASIKNLELLILTTFDPDKVNPKNTREDISDGEQRVYFSATFTRERKVSVRQVQTNVEPKAKELTHGAAITDGALGLYRLRTLPLSKGETLCTDVYGFGLLWRVTAKVVGRERINTPLGYLDAWHITGTSKSLTEKPKKGEGPIEVQLWVSADARRLPLAALAVGKRGVGRMTLRSYTPGSATSAPPAAATEARGTGGAAQ